MRPSIIVIASTASSIISAPYAAASTRCGGFFDVEAKETSLAELEARLSEPDIWADPDKTREIQQERARLQEGVDAAAEIATMLEEALEKYRAAGRRPALELGRVNGQVRAAPSASCRAPLAPQPLCSPCPPRPTHRGPCGYA